MQRTIFAIRHKPTGTWYGGSHVNPDGKVHGIGHLSDDIWDAAQYPTPESAMGRIRYLAEIIRGTMEGLLAHTDNLQVQVDEARKRAETLAAYEVVKLDVNINMTTVRPKPGELGERLLDV